MALTHVATSTPAFNQTNVAPTIPAEAVAGDHAFLWATAKQWTKDFDPATFGGWTLVRSLLVPDVLPGGNTNGTAGQGQVRVGVFYQKVPPGGLTATTIALTGAGSAATTLASGTVSVWRSDTGADLDLSTAVGYDTGTVSAFTVTATSDPGFTAGDQALLLSALTDDGPSWNTIGLSAAGVTFSALTELADLGSALGDDTRVGAFAAAVTDGTSTAAPVFTGTNSAGAGSIGGTTFVRLRETGGGAEPPPSAVTGAGSLIAAAASLSTAGTVQLTGLGALAAAAPSLSGAGSVWLSGLGALVAGTPSLTGAGALRLTGASTLTAPARTLSGAGAIRLTGSGVLVANSPVLSGAGTSTIPVPDTVTGSGSLTAGVRSFTGTGAVSLSGEGHLAVPARTLTGAGTIRIIGLGALTGAAPELSGTGTLRLNGAGVLASQVAALSGSGALRLAGDGALVALPASLIGFGTAVDLDARRDITVTGVAGPAARSVTVTGPIGRTVGAAGPFSRIFTATGPRS